MDADLLKITEHVSPGVRKELLKAPTSGHALSPAVPSLPCPGKGHCRLPSAFPPWLGAALWDYFAFCIYLFNIKNTIH